MSISNKHKTIYAIAKGLRYGIESEHKVMTVSDLALLLNNLEYRAENGKPYVINGRGIYNCIKAAYNSFYEKDGNYERAGWIATAFCNKDGVYPWE